MNGYNRSRESAVRHLLALLDIEEPTYQQQVHALGLVEDVANYSRGTDPT